MPTPEMLVLKPNPGPIDCSQMKGRHEPGVIEFFQRKFPEATIEYESREFRVNWETGHNSTVPDLRVLWPSGKELHIELTTSPYDNKDPKARQRRVMGYFPNVHYIVFYRHTLEMIQAQSGIQLLK